MAASPGLSAFYADLLKPGEAERIVAGARPDLILHLAWCVEHGRFWTDPANNDWLNASMALAEAAVRNGVRRFIGVGTCFEYDWPADGECHENATPLKSHTLYDMCKAGLRSRLDELCTAAGMDFAWARLFHLYGADEHPDRLVADIARRVGAGEPAACSTGLALRDYMDVRDAGAGLVALALSNVTGSVNVASGQAVSIAEIARLIGDIAGRPDLIRLGERPDRANEPARIVADTHRLRCEIGFQPSISLRAGLTDAVAGWRSVRSTRCSADAPKSDGVADKP